MKLGYTLELFRTFIFFSLIVLAASTSGFAQSGNGFEITESVIASGGEPASGGIFELDSTVGQPVEGGAIGLGNFAVTSGFWNYTPLAPTAAPVSVSGRVTTPTGGGLVNAVLYLQTQEGELFVTRSGSFGYYMFENLTAGQTVLISVESKRYTFTPRTVNLADVVTDLDFTPDK